MAYRKCPSCGQSYNGKRCGNCLYEPFGEVQTSYDLHREVEAPRREETPLRRTSVPRTQSRTQTRRKAPGGLMKRIAIIWGVVAVIIVVTSFLSAFFSMMDGVGSSFVSIQAEPEIPMLAEGYVLYEDADILVKADWDGVSPVTGAVTIFVQNFTGKDLVVCTDGVAVNGCMVDDVFFYCDAYPNSVSMATLWVDMETLEDMGIGSIEGIQMAIDIMEEDSYDMMVEDCITGWGGEFRQDLYTGGTVIYDQDGVTVIYQGWEIDEYGDTRLQFYVDNSTETILDLSSSELLIDNQGTSTYLWQRFFPETKAVVYGNLYDFALPDDANCLVELELYLTPDGDWEREVESGALSFHLD